MRGRVTKAPEALAERLFIARRLSARRGDSNNKLYAPEVECITEGKARTPFEFTTSRRSWPAYGDNMRFFRRALAASCIMLTAFGSMVAIAQSHFDRPITIIVGYPAGGGMDAVARHVSSRLAKRIGQSVVVVNKPGAGGAIAAEAAVRARPDGETLLLAETGLIMGHALNPQPNIDPGRSFEPVSMIAKLPLVIVVHPSFAARDLDEFLAEIQQHPGKYNYGSAGNGTPHHFAFELFKRETGAQVVHVPYRGGSAMVGDLVGGGIQIGVLSAQVAKPLIDSGKVRAIASLTEERLSAFPELAAVGTRLKGFDATSRLFVLAPQGTPLDVTTRLNTELRAVLADVELAKLLFGQGALVFYGDNRSVSRYIASEIPKWTGVARAMSIRTD